MNEEGVYEPPGKALINNISVEIIDQDSGKCVVKYVMKDCYFLGANNPQYNYRTNDAISIEITFGS